MEFQTRSKQILPNPAQMYKSRQSHRNQNLIFCLKQHETKELVCFDNHTEKVYVVEYSALLFTIQVYALINAKNNKSRSFCKKTANKTLNDVDYKT